MKIFRFVWKWIVSFCCTFLLIVLGWNTNSVKKQEYKDIMQCRSNKRYILLYPHSTRWDPILYFLFCGSQQFPVCALIDLPWLHKPIVGHLLSLFPGLMGTYDKRKGGQGGLIRDGILAKRIQEQFPNGFAVWINPAGNIHGGEWRTGFYQLAKQLDATLCVAGFDYGSQTAVAPRDGCTWNVNTESEQTLEEKLKYEMSLIVPLHPECSHPPCIKMDGVYQTRVFAPWKNKLSWLLCLLCLLIVDVVFVQSKIF